MNVLWMARVRLWGSATSALCRGGITDLIRYRFLLLNRILQYLSFVCFKGVFYTESILYHFDHVLGPLSYPT